MEGEREIGEAAERLSQERQSEKKNRSGARHDSKFLKARLVLSPAETTRDP